MQLQKGSNMTLNETWRRCIKMWEWIVAELGEEGGRRAVELKYEYLRQHAPEDLRIVNACYFCERAATLADKRKTKGLSPCYGCPGVKVDKTFLCSHNKYAYDELPKKFLAKLKRLDKRR